MRNRWKSPVKDSTNQPGQMNNLINCSFIGKIFKTTSLSYHKTSFILLIFTEFRSLQNVQESVFRPLFSCSNFGQTVTFLYYTFVLSFKINQTIMLRIMLRNNVHDGFIHSFNATKAAIMLKPVD